MTIVPTWEAVVAVMGAVLCIYLWRTLSPDDRKTYRLRRTYTVSKRVILPLTKRLPYISKKYRTYAESIPEDDPSDMK